MKTFTFFITLNILCSCTLVAQWTHIGLEGEEIHQVATYNNTLFANTGNHFKDLYRSTDGGDTWQLCISSEGNFEVAISPTGNVYTNSGYRSTDRGVTWESIFQWAHKIGINSSGTIYITGAWGRPIQCSYILRSSDEGLSWDTIGYGAGWGGNYSFSTNDCVIVTPGWCSTIYNVKSLDTTGILISQDDGMSWYGSKSIGDHIFFGHRGDVYAGGTTVDGLYKTTDLCTTWTKMSNIIPEDLLVLPYGSFIVGTNGGGLYLFSEDGDSLGTLNEGLINLNVHTLAMDSLGYMYAGTDSGIFKRKIPTNTHLVGLAGRSIKDIACGKNAIFAVTADSGSVYRSTDGGLEWSLIFTSGGGKVAISEGQKVFVQLRDSLLHSIDDGISWGRYPCLGGFVGVSPIGTLFSRTIAGDISGSWYCLNRSTDNGMSWLGVSGVTFSGDHIANFSNGNIIEAGVSAWRGGSGYPYYCVTISSNDGVDWNWCDPPSRDLTALTVTADGMVFLGALSGLFLSTETCTNWLKVSTIATSCLLTKPSGKIIAATNGGGLFLFSENGDSLGTLNEGLTNLNVHTLALDSLGYVYAGTDSGVFRVMIPDTLLTATTSHHLQAGWNLISLPIHPNSHNKNINYPGALSDAFEYTGTYEACQELCVCKGYWLKVANESYYPLWGSKIYMDSVNVSVGWNMIGSLSESFSASTITSEPAGIVTSMFMEYDGVKYNSSDTIKPGKGYWVKVNQSGKLILSSLQLLVNANSIKIIHTTELPPPPPEGKENVMNTELPTQYMLQQNYPNPFNPVTTFTYGIPERSRVTLEIYNVLGQIVSTLVNNEQEPGYRSVDWIASNGIGSGLYFYRLTASSMVEPGRMFVQVRKMIVVK